MPSPRPFAPDIVDEHHASILADLLAWANTNDNVRTIIQTGSSSRLPSDSDRFSDRDIELICRDPAPLIADDGWIHALAPVWVALYLANDPGDFETRLVFFEDARKVDFTIADESRIADMKKAGHLDDLYERGYRVLLDKDGLTGGLPSPTGSSPRMALPTETEFAATVAEFWFEAAHMPTYLNREDFWVVKFRDWTMKEMLLRLLQWHALYTRGPETDVWHIGSKMKRWVDEATWEELQGAFGHFDAGDSFRALMASMRLCVRLTHEIADIAGFTVPESERYIHAYVTGFVDAFPLAGSS